MENDVEFQVLTFTVEPPFHGWRVDRYLCHKLPRLSRTKAQKLIRAGLVSERPLKPSSPVLPGMVLSMRRRREDEPPTPTELPLLHRDEEILIFDKPAGLPIHATARYLHGTLVALARKQALPGEKPDPAHRLDRETSGLVVCGTHLESTRSLKLAFAQGLVHKRYLALTEGWPSEDAFEVDAPLSVGGAVVRVRVFVDHRDGKPSKTRFRVIERRELKGQKFALVQCEPVTGRQHQIRVHLASRGLPIVGDKIYGADERIFARFSERRLTVADKRLLRLPRHALHAAHIEFPHPRDGRLFQMDSPLPKDLAAFFFDGELDQWSGVEDWVEGKAKT
jgi:23S rRNA pseudouridine1911/1915/1917 synthase